MIPFQFLFRSEPFENLQICFKQHCDNEADCPFSDQCRLDPDSCEVTIDNETLDFTNFTIKGKTRAKALSKTKGNGWEPFWAQGRRIKQPKPYWTDTTRVTP